MQYKKEKCIKSEEKIEAEINKGKVPLLRKIKIKIYIEDRI